MGLMKLLVMLSPKTAFPKKILGVEYSLNWHCSGYRLCSIEGDHATVQWPVELDAKWHRPVSEMIVCRPSAVAAALKGKDADGLIDGLLPTLRLGKLVALYRVENFRIKRRSPWYDGLDWDNGSLVDLVFEMTVEASQLPWLDIQLANSRE